MKRFVLPLFLILCFNLFSQVVLERDINEQPAPSDPTNFIQLGTNIYFEADDGFNGSELYKYDLITETAEIVANIRPYEEGNNITELVTFDGKVYFNAYDGVGVKPYLYVHNPADNSTQRVIDSNNDDVRDPSVLIVFDNKLFFSADDPEFGYELMSYDPTINLIEVVADLNDNGDTYIREMEIASGQLWLSADNDQSDSYLWRHDPSSGTTENIFYTSPDGFLPPINSLHHFDNKLFFSFFISGEGNELGAYDIASNEIIDLPEIYPGAGSSAPQSYFNHNGKMYFTARSVSIGREIRVYDPLTETISLLADIHPDDDANPGLIHELNGTLYLTASINDTDRHIFSYDPNTEMLTQGPALNNNGINSGLNVEIIADGVLFLSGEHPSTARELYAYTPGNSEINLAADINVTTIGSDPYGFTEYNGKLYFGADEINSGREIWVYDPATGNVDILSDSPGSIAPNNFTVLDGKLFFSGNDPDLGYGLLYYDDATGEINPTSYNTPNNIGHVTNIISYQNLLFFKANDDVVGDELFMYDPATDLFSLVADINPNGDSHPGWLYVFNDEIYFEADDGVAGDELWKYNHNTGTVSMVADINPGPNDSSPAWLVEHDGYLYLKAYQDGASFELHRYDPVNDVVEMVTDVSGNLDPRFLTVYKDKIFFSGRFSAQTNAELLYYDPATDELVLTEDLNPSASNPQYMTVFNDKLYFSTLKDEYGRELWEYNDTSLSIVADIRSGVPDSDPSFLTNFNGKIYFSANDGLRGAEIWSIAECLNIFVDTESQIGENGSGSIDLTVTGGLPPYTFSWSNGASSEDIDNLEAGFYTVTVMDASGCISELTAEVIFEQNTSNENIITDHNITVFPNPNNGMFAIDTKGLMMERIELFDAKGQLVYQQFINGQTDIREVQMQYALAGIYVLKITTTDGVFIEQVSLIK